MKRLIILGLIITLLFSGCAHNVNNGDEVVQNTDYISGSDGVITPMSVEELISMLSKLDNNSTMSDVADVFGKEPRMVAETNSDLWEYFSGKIIIRLSGINLQDGRL